MKKKSTYHVIGIMSGTSLDGIDIAFCQFKHANKQWYHNILYADCFRYTNHQKTKLQQAHLQNKIELQNIHIEYGKTIGTWVNQFISLHKIDKTTIDFIASHGHTVFHQPEKRETLQIGCGQEIANTTDIPVVWDFRTADVKMGGQGAPLVPIGDELLFPQYNQCLNLGGFSNISFKQNEKRIAYDICPVNFVLNALAAHLGKSYDENGEIAKNGSIIPELLQKLENLAYYQQKPPKSLGREWVEKAIFPLLDTKKYSIKNLLRTFSEHIILRLSSELKGKVLITGGGALNSWLMQELQQKSKADIFIPDKETVEYKEALIFAFLAVLRWENQINILASVTGAPKNHSSGRISFPQ